MCVVELVLNKFDMVIVRAALLVKSEFAIKAAKPCNQSGLYDKVAQHVVRLLELAAAPPAPETPNANTEMPNPEIAPREESEQRTTSAGAGACDMEDAEG